MKLINKLTLRHILQKRHDVKLTRRVMRKCLKLARIKQQQERERFQYQHQLDLNEKDNQIKYLQNRIDDLHAEKQKYREMRIQLEIQNERLEKVIYKLQDKTQGVFGNVLNEVDKNIRLIDKHRKREA